MAKINLHERESEIGFKKNRVKLSSVLMGLRSNHVFELNSLIGAALLLTFTLNYGKNILVWLVAWFGGWLENLVIYHLSLSCS